MLNQYVDQLRSADPEMRRQAIIALGKQKDPAALRPLAEVYQNDPDPALRELAMKAGRYIKSHAPQTAPIAQPARTAQPTVTAQTESPSSMEALRRASNGTAVSPRNVERAKGYFDRALDFYVREEKAKAVEMMGKAIETNPNLSEEPMFLNMAMELTSQGSTASVNTLRDPEERRALIDRLNGMEPGTGRARRVNDQDWGGALLDIAIYGLVNGAIAFVIMLVAMEALAQFMLASFAAAGPANMPPGMMGLEDLATSGITLPLAGLYGIIYAIISMVMLVLMDGAAHLVATTVMGGEGSLVGLIRRTTLFFTVLVPLSTGISLLPIFLSDPTQMNPAFSLLSLAFSIGTAVWAGKLTGDAYNFGTSRGCLSIFLGSLALAILFICCFFTLGMALLQTFSGLPM